MSNSVLENIQYGDESIAMPNETDKVINGRQNKKSFPKSKKILYNGKTQSLRSHIKDAGLGYGTVQARLAKGMTLEEALALPPGKTGTRYHGNPPPKPPLQRELHGLSETSEYNIYLKMISRCHNEKDKVYSYYGARGIEVCQIWRSSFMSFIQDMGFRPSKEHSIERKDNDGGYNPDNCKWATKLEQSNNRRSNRVVEYNGQTMTATQLSEELNVGSEFVYQRLNRGTPVDEIVEQAKEYRNTFHTYKGKLKTLSGHAIDYGISYKTLKKRMSAGLTIDEAIELPAMPGVFLTTRIKR